MSPDEAPAPKSRGWLRLLIAFVVAFDAAAFFQWADGAFQSEFGGHPEEAQNYLAGLRVHEALVHARDRESAGGKISAAAESGSKWGFSLMLGGWMTVFGKSRIAVLLFMAVLAAATATLIFCAVRRELGGWAAAVASLLWLCAPAARGSYETVLPELLGAFILTGAGLLWARRIDGGSLGRTAASKWIHTAALLGGAGVLAVAVAAALKITPGDPHAAWTFLNECISVPGIAVAVFAVAGIVMSPRSDARGGAVWIAMVALVAGVLFSSWMKAGVPDVRVLIVATPALAMLAARGAISLARIVAPQPVIARENPRRNALWLFLLLLLALPPDLLSPWQKAWSGFGPAALAVVEESRGPARVLVVSDARGEGMFLSEFAMRDREGKITVERGSETLADSSDPASRNARQRFLEDEQLFAHLTAGRIQYIVLDSAVPGDSRAGYHDQVRRVLEDNVRSFWPICDSPVVRDGEPRGHPLRIFRVMQSPGAELR